MGSTTSEKIDREDVHELNLPADGHELWEWQTKYDGDAWKYIWREFIYLSVMLLIAFSLLYFSFSGLLFTWHNCISTVPADFLTFKKEAYCAISGLLGGCVYGIKILYKAVARGKWHYDRVLWRYATPWVSLALSLVIASLMAEDIFAAGNFAAIIIGFFAGYFSESAIGKLYDIAKVVFN